MPNSKRTSTSCCRCRKSSSRRARNGVELYIEAYCKLWRDASFGGLTDSNAGVKLNQRSELFPIKGVRGPRGNFTPNNQSPSARLPHLGGAVAKGPEGASLRIPPRRVGWKASLFAVILTCLASNAEATSCWCKILPDSVLSSGGIYYSLGQGRIAVQRYPDTPCPENSFGVEITLSGPGFTAQECTSFGGAYCNFPAPGAPNVPDGTGVFTITCKAFESSEGGVNTFKYDSDSLSIVVDNTPPVVAITQAPPDGSTLPYTSFHVEGTVNDGSPIVSFQTESGVQISTNGSQWFVDFATAGEYTGAPPTTVVGGVPLSGPLDFSLTARDLVGNVVAVATSPAAPFAGVDPALRRVWYFDGLPPTVDFSSSSIGSLTQITSIRGTASDNYRLEEIKLHIKENFTGKYWNGAQFVAGITTITLPLPQVENSPWEYTELNSDEMVSESSYTVNVTAYDALQGATVISAVLSLAPTFVGEGIVADMFNGALVQFLVTTTPTPYISLGDDNLYVCVKYASQEVRNAVRFLEFPRASVVVLQQSYPDPIKCPVGERLDFASIIPAFFNPNPTLVTGCDEHSELRAYIGSQIVGRFKFDIVIPKKESSEILKFRNDYARPQQITGFPRATNSECQFEGNDSKCVGYLHKIIFERGPDPLNRNFNFPPGTWIREKILDISDANTQCVPGSPHQKNDFANTDPDGRIWVGDFNGYTSSEASSPFPPNCTDKLKQEFFIGKCRFTEVDVTQMIRKVNGTVHYYFDRTDHNNSSLPYPVPPP